MVDNFKNHKFAVMEFSSKLLENAVSEIKQLPGIGRNTALRLVLHLLKRPEEQSLELAKAITDLRTKIKFCKICNNISDAEICEICKKGNRDHQIVCVVEDIRDVMAIENTSQYRGVYHVLGGKISPMDGIGPNELNITSLVERVKEGKIQEIIFALSSTMEGDTTNFYIYKQLKELPIKTSTIARGIGVGDELEYADQITLRQSILQRVPFEKSLKK